MHIVSTKNTRWKCWPVWLLVPLCVLFLGGSYGLYARSAYPLAYVEQIEAACEEYAFPPSLVYAIVRVESDFRADARSSADARGLMQITESTFEWAQSRSGAEERLQADDLYNPDINIHYGVFILKLLREQFEDEDAVLAAYNAGAGQVQAWLNDPACSTDGKTLDSIPYSETEKYIQKVRIAQENYRQLYGVD